jgi:hypothetical protein
MLIVHQIGQVTALLYLCVISVSVSGVARKEPHVPFSRLIEDPYLYCALKRIENAPGAPIRALRPVISYHEFNGSNERGVSSRPGRGWRDRRAHPSGIWIGAASGSEHREARQIA